MSFFPRLQTLPHTPNPLRQTISLPTSPTRKVHITHIKPRPAPPPTPLVKPRNASTATVVGSGTHAGGSGSGGGGKKKSAHLVWYREIVPAMIPIILVSSTIFLSLSLLRTHLSHNLALSESSAKIADLESQLATVRVAQRKQLERERKERERILPLVVERVLQRVGAMGVETEEVLKEEGERLLV